MNKLLIVLGLTVVSTVAVYVVHEPAPAKCSVCYSSPCYDRNQCGGQGCVCVRKSTEMTGYCVSMD